MRGPDIIPTYMSSLSSGSAKPSRGQANGRRGGQRTLLSFSMRRSKINFYQITSLFCACWSPASSPSRPARDLQHAAALVAGHWSAVNVDRATAAVARRRIAWL